MKNNISNDGSHYFKLRFRIFLPLLVRLFHIQHIGVNIFIIEFVLGFLFVGLLLKFTEKYSNSKINSLYLVLILATLYVVSSFWTDFIGYGDALAFFFLFVSVYYENVFIVFLCLLCSYFIDERALVNSSFVLAWYCWIKNYLSSDCIHQNKINKWTIFTFNVQVVAVALSWIVYCVIRFWLEKNYFNTIPAQASFVSEFVSTYYENIKIVGINIWRGFKGSSALFILLFVLMVSQKKTIPLVLFFVPLVLIFNLSFIAYDISRSVGYSFLATIFCFLMLSKELTDNELRKILIAVFLITATCPNFSFMRLPAGYSLF